MHTHLAAVSINDERGTFDLDGRTYGLSSVVQVTYDRESRRGRVIVADGPFANEVTVTLASAWKLMLFLGTETCVGA
jgi:hypothetical protein